MTHFDLPKDRVIDGESIVPVLEGKTLSRHKPILTAIDMPFQDDPTDMWALRDGDWKMIFDRDSKPKYLYNMKLDRGETMNQLGKQPEVEKRLVSAFENYKYSVEHDTLMEARGEKPTPVDWN